MAYQFCTQCGKLLPANSRFCAACGAKTGVTSMTELSTDSENKSPKSAITALLLCIFLGPFGAHRFYVGKIGTGILMLLTAGGFGIWSLIDLVFIACCEFKDKEGRRLVFTRGKGSPLKLALTIIGCFIAGVIVYAFFLFMLVIYLTSGLTDTVRNQLTALRSGDIEKAYYSYTAADFQNTTSLRDFTRFVKHFPALIHNQSVSFSERQISDGKGFLSGTLVAEDGTKTYIEYRLEKENNDWKILEIVVPPQAVTKTNGHADVYTYEDDKNRFTIQYPTFWNYQKRNNNSIAFGGKQDTMTNFTTVTIQFVLSKKTGGIYKNIQDVVDDLEQQISKQASDVKFEDTGEVTLPQNSNIHGIGFIATYTYKGLAVKKMQFVLEQPDGSYFYTWAYTAVADRYKEDLPIAKAMYESWNIK